MPTLQALAPFKPSAHTHLRDTDIGPPVSTGYTGTLLYAFSCMKRLHVVAVTSPPAEELA